MDIRAKKIYRDYVLKNKIFSAVRYCILFFVLAVYGPFLTYVLTGAVDGSAEMAEVTQFLDGGFLLRYYDPKSGYEQFLTVKNSAYPIPVFQGQDLLIRFTENGISVDILSGILSIIALLIAVYSVNKAVYYVYLRIKNKKNVEKILTEGKEIICKIDRIEKRMSIFRNFRVVLTHTDIYGKTYHFETERYYFDPKPYLGGADSMKVYVDPMNYDLYYIIMPETFPDEPQYFHD